MAFVLISGRMFSPLSGFLLLSSSFPFPPLSLLGVGPGSCSRLPLFLACRTGPRRGSSIAAHCLLSFVSVSSLCPGRGRLPPLFLRLLPSLSLSFKPLSLSLACMQWYHGSGSCLSPVIPCRRLGNLWIMHRDWGRLL